MTKEELALATIEFKLDQLTQKVENLTLAAEKGKDLPEWVSLALAVEKKAAALWQHIAPGIICNLVVEQIAS